MKKEITLKEIQEVSLDTLKHIRDFCEKHDIKFFIAYGTLLGAVRHKGFIPWDDDIDIVMPRPDYDRFVEQYKNTPEYSLFTYHNSGAIIPFARVCEMKRTEAVFHKSPWIKEKVGIYVDIFPLDAVEKEGFEEKKAKADYLWRKGWILRYALVSPRSIPVNKMPKWAVRKVNQLLNTKKRIERHIDFCKAQAWATTPYLAQFSVPDPHEGIILKNWYDDTVLLPFEDDAFPAPKMWHEVLTNIFSDYMSLPPESERVPHISNGRFFWKDDNAR